MAPPPPNPGWGALPRAIAVLVGIAHSLALAAPGEPPSVDNAVLELDGQGAYVELPVAAFDSLQTATLEAWVRVDDWGLFSQWFAYGSPSEPWRATGINHFDRSSSLQYFTYGSRGLHVVAVTVPQRSTGRWFHMAAVSGRQGMRFYLDGLLVGSDAYDGSFADLPAQGAFLGRSTWAENDFFHGAVDEVRLWSVARTGEQIADGMGRALRGTEPGLVGLWSFDHGDGRDATPARHDATLRDGARCVPAPFPGSSGAPGTSLLFLALRDVGSNVLPDPGLRLLDPAGRAHDYGIGPGLRTLAVPEPGTYDLEVSSDHAAIPSERVDLGPRERLHLDLRPPPPSLVARWPADGNTHDAVGDHEGVLLGEVSYAPGIAGQAFQFSGGEQDIVRIPAAADLVPDGSFTVTAWIHPTANRELRVLGVWGDEAAWTDQRAYLLRILPGMRPVFDLSDVDHQRVMNREFITRTNAVPLDAWSMLAGVWDAAQRERRVYVNGALVGRGGHLAGDAPRRSIADLGIGGSLSGPPPWPLQHPFRGRIDDVRLYDVALHESEIQQLYAVHAEAHWPADGNAADASGRGHDGSPVNGVTYADGVRGQAFVFDGIDSYIEAGHIGNYGVADFTLDLWLRIDAPAASMAPIAVRRTAEGDALALRLDTSGHLVAVLASPQDSVQLRSATALPAHAWHHVALVRQGRQVHLFVDGAADGVAASAQTLDLRARVPLRLGGEPGAPSFRGRLDEVTLHDRALGADEIRQTARDVLAERQWHRWRSRLRTGGLTLLGLLVLVAAGRAESVRRTRRRERQQLADAERARQAADAASRAKSTFLAHVSHEIRTPLNAMLGHAQVLRDRSSVGADERRSLEAICDQGDHLLQLLNDVLDLAKVEAGRQELQLTELHIGRLADGLARLFEVRCRQKGLQFRVEVAPAAGWVRADEGKLRQVLGNLLSNAVKFTDTGEVVMRVERTGDDHVFEVEDTGPGIAPELQQRVFQPFEQGPVEVPGEGTGLGLAIARRHVQLMGGQLELKTAPGRGSCFRVVVPLERVAAAPEALAAAAPDAGASVAGAVDDFDGLVLPRALRADLRQAAQMQSVTGVKSCLERLRILGEREARLADILSGAVARFDMRPVVRALEGTVDG